MSRAQSPGRVITLRTEKASKAKRPYKSLYL
jgi:hypothetical protein